MTDQGAMPAYPEWRPIESAPKDGTAILGFWSIFIDGHPIDGNNYAVTRFADGDWRSVDMDNTDWAEPSHWMPLPEPPALSDQPTRQEGAQP